MTEALRLLVCMLLILSVSIVSAREVQEQPNIIVIFLDDSGYGDFSHTGNPTISTPHISRLASQGVSFTQFYTPSPACSASRYALLTGRIPSRSGLESWAIGPSNKRFIHPDEVTIAEGLKTAGYKTALFGKWHLGNPNTANEMARESLPLAHGFDEWLGTNVSHDYDDAKLLVSDTQGNRPIAGYRELARNLPSDRKASESLTRVYTEKTLAFIEKNKRSPFFIYLAHNQPHLGLYADENYYGRSRRGRLGDVMAELDDSVGNIVSALEEHNIAENTLIVFSSDNGPWIRFQNTAEHSKYGEARLHVGYALPFRDGKGSNWEGGHRVPGIFYWPGTIQPNPWMQVPASTLDLLPTVFALTGVEIPGDRSIDGRDIRPLLIPEKYKQPIPEFKLPYTNSENNIAALRVGPWKMLTDLYSQTGDSYGFVASRKKPLLFQLEQDLGERIDRSSEQRKQLKKLQAVMAEFETNSKKEGSYWND